MKKLRTYWSRWRKFGFSEKVAFFRAALCLTVIKFGLTTLPFSTFRKLYHWFSKTDKKAETSRQQIDTTVWAVRSAADHLPFELLCLPRALATKYLLRHVPALTLEIGVDITAAKVFEAHAWVEKNGLIIIGDWPETVSYQRLWVWE